MYQAIKGFEYSMIMMGNKRVNYEKVSERMRDLDSLLDYKRW